MAAVVDDRYLGRTSRMVAGRAFETSLDFVRPEFADLRGTEYNPHGRTEAAKRALRKRVFMPQPFVIQDARAAPGGITSFDLDTHGFAYMQGLLPPWPRALANPFDHLFPDWEDPVDGLPHSSEYLPQLAEACRRFVDGADGAYVTNYILRSDTASEGRESPPSPSLPAHHFRRSPSASPRFARPACRVPCLWLWLSDILRRCPACGSGVQCPHALRLRPLGGGHLPPNAHRSLQRS